MATVVSCLGCERFVHTSDGECPFCGTSRPIKPVVLRRPHLARAAIVALALTGCAPVYGGPPPEILPPPSEEEETPAEVEEETPAVEEETSAEDETPELDDVEQVAPPYGAAPPEQ